MLCKWGGLFSQVATAVARDPAGVVGLENIFAAAAHPGEKLLQLAHALAEPAMTKIDRAGRHVAAVFPRHFGDGPVPDQRRQSLAGSR